MHKPISSPLRPRGFTLLELIAVVVCTGILSLIGYASFQQVRFSADLARVRTDMETITRNAQAIARSEKLFQVHLDHLERATAEMSTTAVATGGSSLGVFAVDAGDMIYIPDYPTGGQGAGDVLGVDYGPSLTYGYVSYKTSGTLIGLATRSEMGGCVFMFIDGVNSYDPWTVKDDIGAACRGSNALAGRQDPGTYSYQDPLSYGSPAQTVGVAFVSATAESVSITWSPSTATDLLGYKVYVDGSVASGGSPLNLTSYTITGLAPNSLYVVSVSAIDTEALEGAQSAPLNTITVPATPTGLAATAVSPTAIDVSWNAQALSTFRVYVNTNLTYTGTTPSFSFTAADPATTYAFQVDAFNTSGGSPISTAVNATTFPAEISGFAYSAASSSQSEIGLNWTPATGVITGYKIYRDSTTSILADITDPTTAVYVDSGRTAGASHTYRIRAYNATGDGALSAGVVGFAVPADPSTPSSASHTTSGLVLSWGSVSGATSYQVYRNTALIASQAGTSYTDGGLTSGTSFSYQVSACNTAGCSSISPSHTGLTTPAAVTGFTVDADSSSVNLTWTASASPVVSGYKVYYKTSAAASYTLDATVAGVSTHQVANLTPGEAYDFKVAAYNASGETDSTVQSAVPYTVPSQVSAPTLSNIALTTIDLAWTAPSNGGSAITGYTVIRNSAAIASLGASTTSYADSGLTAGTSFSYQVIAINIAGSSPVSAASTAPTLPAAATSVIATAGYEEVVVSWTDSVSPVVSGHKVYYRAGTSGAYTLHTSGATASSPVTITGLTGQQLYSFEVVASNSSGSTDSSAASATPFTIPGAPGTPSFTSATTTEITVSWTAPDDNGGSPVASYEVVMNATLPQSVSGSTTSATFSSLDAGTNYSFTVRAQNGASFGPYSSSGIYATRPAAATSVSGSQTSGTPSSITVSWTDSVSPVVAGYEVYYRAGTSGAFAEWTPNVDDTSPTTVTGLIAGTAYYFRVDSYVVNGGIKYETSSTIAGPVTAITTPAVPASVATAPTNSALSLTWNASTSTTAAPVSGYNVYLKLASEDTYPLSPSATTASLTTTISGLTNGSTYDFKVVSYNVAGESLVLVSSATPYNTPAAPAITQTVAGYGQVDVTFTAGSNGGNTISSYTAYVYNASTDALAATRVVAYTGNTQTITVPADNSLTVGASGTNYYVKVSATNAGGESDLSDQSTTVLVYSTPSTPGTPTLVSQASGTVTMSWSASASNFGSALTGYRLDAFTSSSSTASTSGFCTTNSSTTSCAITSLDNATTYFFRSRSVNAAGFSDYSAASIGYNPATSPAAPAATGSYAHGANGAVAGAGSLTIGIPAVADNGSTVTSGTAEVLLTSNSSAVGSCTVAGAAAGTCVVSALDPQTSYTVRTKRTNGMGDSAYYTVGTITLIGKPSIGSLAASHGTPAAQSNGGTQYNTYSVSLVWASVAYAGTTPPASPFATGCTVNTSPVTSDHTGTSTAAATTASYSSNLVTASGNGSANTTATSRTCSITASGSAPLNAMVGDISVSTAATTFTSTSATSTVALPGYAYPYPYPSFYAGHYPSHYPAHYPTHYSGHYPAHYPGHYPVHYSGHYPAHYPGHYPVHYSGHYPAHYPGHYPVHYSGHYPAHYPGHYPVHYSGHYPRHYPGHYPIHYSGHYPRHYPIHGDTRRGR